MAWIKKQKEKIMKLFLYQRIKKYVFCLDTVNAAALQKKFKIGYAKAVEMLERLKDDGRIMLSGGKWYVLYGIRLRTPDDIISISVSDEATTDFTEENIVKLLDRQSCISTSLLQRQFSVSYGRAASMMDQLVEKGYIHYDGQTWVKVKS